MTASVARIPCTVVTGFLGAGKTTLIRNILENAGGRRLAIIVNEFGDVGIDGDISTASLKAIVSGVNRAIRTRERSADLAAVFDRDPACSRYLEPLLYFKGFHGS